MQPVDIISKLSEKFLGKALQSSDAEKITQGIKKTITVQAASYLLVFISNILMVRVAGVQNYGMYVTVINWMSLLSVMACQGMEDVVLAEIPASITAGDFTNARKITVFANRVTFIGAAMAMLVFFVLTQTGWVPLFSNNKFVFYAALINVYLFGFIIVNQQALQAVNRFYASQLADKIIKPLLFTLLFGILYLTSVKFGAVTLITTTTIVQFICVLLVLFFLKDTFKHTLSCADGDAWEKPLRYGYSNIYFFVISLLYLLKAKIAIFIFGFTGTIADTGIFNILSRLADFVIVPFFIIHTVAPQLFARHKEADKQYKKELFSRLTLISSTGAILVFAGIILLGKFLLGLYGNAMIGNYSLLLVLSAAQLLYSLFGPSSALLMMQGRQKQAAFILLADVAVSIILFIVFIKAFGLEGAVWATVFSVFIYNLLLRVMVNKIIN
jgi:O-antigen/teichoic acid export membrane protein